MKFYAKKDMFTPVGVSRTKNITLFAALYPGKIKDLISIGADFLLEEKWEVDLFNKLVAYGELAPKYFSKEERDFLQEWKGNHANTTPEDEEKAFHGISKIIGHLHNERLLEEIKNALELEPDNWVLKREFMMVMKRIRGRDE